MRDLRQTSQYASYLEKIDWKIERLGNSFAFIKKVPVIGNLIKIQRPEKISTSLIKSLIREYKPFQIIIEPKNKSHQSLVVSLGYKESKSYFLPSKTIHIDLTRSEKELLAKMHYKTRYNIKKAIRSKLKTKKDNNIESFAEFWQKCAVKQRGMFISQKKEITEMYKAFRKSSHLILISDGTDNTTLAGVLMIQTKNIAYYMFAASTTEGKKLFAPSLAAWEAIKLAKKLKCKIFDFEGIYDERFPLKSWEGFTRFKNSFGGKTIEYPGAFSKLMFPFKLFGRN